MFIEDAIESYNDNGLAWMLFVDGCSSLHFMENVDDQCPEPEALNLKFDQLMHMENQLPSKMLEILCKEKGIELEYWFSNYHSLGEYKRLGMVMIALENPNPFHILDSFRSIYLSRYTYKLYNIKGNNQMETQSDGNEDSQTDEWNWSNISFTSKWFSGELRLPIFLFNDVTPYLFRNLIAYEMCPDVRYNYECCSFFTFMDSLIDNAEDAKELRVAGVFQNLLESDEELAKLLNELGDDLPTKMYCNFSYTNAVAFSKKIYSRQASN